MRIEKINDHQIRCTLNEKDLSDRELRISELAYGTDKAKSLFRDMMQQASYEFGFEADDIPLMIEAVPLYPDSLVLIITKVDDPDELDTRFSHFTDDPDHLDDTESPAIFSLEDEPDLDSYTEDMYDELTSSDEETPDPFDTPSGGITLADSDNEENDTTDKETDFISLSKALGKESRPKSKDSFQKDIIKIFSFQTLQELTSLAEYIIYQYSGVNTVYKDEKKGCYYLILHKSEHTPEEFNKVCNLICEYGRPVRNTYASHSYYEEHYEPLIKDRALQVLASL